MSDTRSDVFALFEPPIGNKASLAKVKPAAASPHPRSSSMSAIEEEAPDAHHSRERQYKITIKLLGQLPPRPLIECSQDEMPSALGCARAPVSELIRNANPDQLSADAGDANLQQSATEKDAGKASTPVETGADADSSSNDRRLSDMYGKHVRFEGIRRLSRLRRRGIPQRALSDGAQHSAAGFICQDGYNGIDEEIEDDQVFLPSERRSNLPLPADIRGGLGRAKSSLV